MKLLKSILVGALLLNTVLSFSQEEKTEKTPEERAAHMTEKMTNEFSLSKKDAAEVGKLNLEFMHTVVATKDNNELSKEDKMAAIEKASNTLSDGLESILSSEDFAKFKEKQAEKKAKFEAKKAEQNQPELRAAKKTQKLFDIITDLSPDQKERIEKLNLMVENKIQVIKEDESMSDEKKKEFIRGNRKDQKNALKSILTAEQFAQLEKAKADKKAEHSEK